ncbi:hypothetical protein DVH24_029729 [Malus domestica]|uniref:Uncharacterized protein n=1 Tax=Malus domestica TaxID=3750 RepID=A0A498HTV1_MALDO|nr:hypothetical protein DVH24_029729 [Malus domestica]
MFGMRRTERESCSVLRLVIGQIEALQNTKKERPRGYIITIRSNLERRCRAEVHREATRKRMRRKVEKGRCKAEEVHSGREEKMIVRTRGIFVLKCYKFVFHGGGTSPSGGGGGTKNHPKLVPWNSAFHLF